MRKQRFFIQGKELFDAKINDVVGDLINDNLIELRLEYNYLYDEKLLYRILRETKIKDIWYNRKAL